MRILTLSTCLLVCIASVSNQAKADYQSRVIYGVGARIYAYDLAKDKSELIYEAPQGLIESVSAVGDKRILISTSVSDADILELDLDSAALRKIVRGRSPTYLAEHGKLAFYDRPEGAPNAYLFVADFDNPTRTRREVDRGPFVRSQPAIQISRDEFVFSSLSPEIAGPESSLRGLGKYNIVTGEKTRVPIGYCIPEIWRSVTKELLCLDTLKHRRFFTDLKGREREVAFVRGFQPILYIPSRDAILGVQSRFEFGIGELWDQYIWDFKENRALLLLENAPTYLGAAAWFD